MMDQSDQPANESTRTPETANKRKWFAGPSTFRTRIFWSIVPIFLILFGLMGAVNFHRQSQMVQQQFLKRGEAMVRHLAFSEELGVFAEDEQLLEPSIRGLEADEDVAYVFIYGQDDKLLHKGGRSADPMTSEALGLTQQDRQQLKTTRGPISRWVEGAEGPFLEYIAPVLSATDTSVDEQLIGLLEPPSSVAGGGSPVRVIGHVRLGLSLAPQRRNTMAFVQLWVVLTLTFLILSTAAMYFLSRRITGPIKRLTDHADKIAHGDLDQVIPVESRDEIGQLAASFNNMAHALKWNISRKGQLLEELQELNQTLEVRISRRTMELQERTEALEIASKHKSEFLAKMSHELRTPLNAVIGYSEMLEEEAEDLGVTQFIPDLRKIHSSGKHLLGLINDVLDLAKVEAGKIELFCESFDVRSMVYDVSATIDPLVKKNGNTLRIACADDVGQMHSDLTRVRQCLFNLLSNACKFTENGTVGVDVTRQCKDGRSWLCFRISDTGIGMTDEQMGKIFQAFQQADASTSHKYGGTGLGLAISRQFCRMLGGDIGVESESGKGSAFTIRLPVVEDGQAGGAPVEGETGPAAQAAAQPSGPLALVVDDDDAARDLLTRCLKKEGFEVVSCASGNEALQVAKQRHPDVMTLDVIMPGLDGWAVLKALKDDSDTQDIPVIMTTVMNEKNMGFALGATEYLTKPVDRERLSHVLKKYRCRFPQDCARSQRPVLVVEDDVPVRQMLRRILEKAGWSVVEAENGRAGLDCVAKDQPSLVLLDLMMPEMDGFEFVLRLRETDAWRDIPVIVLTSKDITEEDRRRLNGGVEQIWQKGGYSREEMIREVRKLVLPWARLHGETVCPVCDKAGSEVQGADGVGMNQGGGTEPLPSGGR